MIELSDADILARLTNPEDSTVERKTASDYRDCVKTGVAFSNSLSLDDPGIIFVGVGNDGTPQDRLNLDSLQRGVSKELAKIYPPILPQMKVMRKDAREFLAVIVRGSAHKPHFAGPSYIRDGSQTVEASKGQFERLIAERNSKTREILKWRNKDVTIYRPMRVSLGGSVDMTSGGRGVGKVLDCNQFYVTLEKVVIDAGRVESLSLSEFEIGFDGDKQRLELRMHRDG